jgi:antitoxin (DNA-binding transcriptional repressor) of toxin-antitoxin stability system
MAAMIPVEEAQATLQELIDKLAPGEEVILTENQQPVAKLIGARPLRERKLGTLRGTVLYVAPDFDAPLEDFKEYME